MKRLTASILLGLYLYNLAGYIPVCLAEQAQAKSRMRRSIRHDPPAGLLHLVRLSPGECARLRWLEEDEFVLEGRMYDVVRRTERAGAVLLLCVRDEEEEALIRRMHAHIEAQTGTHGSAGADSAITAPREKRDHMASAPVPG
ncbi:MAG: hypothetical protein WB626_00010, partial [Bacteroidota bacterium]